jgi:hypothetical protein
MRDWTILKTLAFVLGTILPLALTGQVETDVVYLRNGQQLEGRIVEYQQGVRLLFRLSGGEVVELREEEVERIVQKGYLPAVEREEAPAKAEAPKPYLFKDRGWYNALYFATMNSGGPESGLRMGIGLHNSTGYQFHRLFGLGLGLGIDTYGLSDGKSIYPLFAEARGYLLKKSLTPYYSFCAGYGLAFKNRSAGIIDADGGTMFRGIVGLRLGASADTNVLLGVGYQYQEASFVRELFGGGGFREIQELTFHRIVMRVGLIF